MGLRLRAGIVEVSKGNIWVNIQTIVKGETPPTNVEEYLLSLIDLAAELALARNKKAYVYLRELYSLEVLMKVVQMESVHYSLRSRLLRLLLTLYLDRDPIFPLQVPSATLVWRELEPYHRLTNEHGELRSLIKYNRNSKMDFSWLKKFVVVYLGSLQGIQRLDDRN